jgi:hypothetical protein
MYRAHRRLIGPRWVNHYPDEIVHLHYRANHRFIGPNTHQPKQLLITIRWGEDKRNALRWR